MRQLLVFMALLTAALTSLAAPKEYWVCADSDGTKVAQDRACGPTQRTVSASAVRVASSAEAANVSRSELGHPIARRLQATPPRPAPTTTRTPTRTERPRKSSLTGALWTLAVFVAIGVALQKSPKGRGRRRARTRDRNPDRSKIQPATYANIARSVNRTESLLSSLPLRGDLSAAAQAKPTQWSMDVLQAMEWKRFEELCEHFWKIKGYPARSTGPGADGGVDVVIEDRRDSSKVFAIAQCKAKAKPIGVEPVRALWGCKDHFQAQLAIFYSLTGYSDDAIQFAKGKHLKLVSGAELLKQVLGLPEPDQKTLLAHVTRGDYTTPSCPKCEIKLVLREGKNGKSDYWGCPQFRSCRSKPIPARGSRTKT